jgi:hypothetical protein
VEPARAVTFPTNQREARCLFTRLLTAELMPWAYQQAQLLASPLFRCEFALDEATVHSPRKARKAGMVFEVLDAEHGDRGRFRSLHHDGRAVDLLVYRGGEYVADGGDRAYRTLGARWLTLHPWCAWGGDFSDANHFSLRDGNRR